MKKLLFTTLLILAFLDHSIAQISITAESGLAFNGYNDVRFFNGQSNRGDLFSLTDDFKTEQPAAYIRAELKWQFLDKNIIELTAAPSSFNYTDLKRNSLSFGDEVFTPSGTTARYEFNTYRASYRYEFLQGDKWYMSAGLTVLLRDARIALRQGNVMEETTNLGAVPLLSFDLSYLCSERLEFLLKGDALFSGQGRAEDVLLGARYKLIDNGLFIRAGYRIIEGGADASEVYNFSFIHFAALGLSYSF